jgi:hypothetical protein
MHLTDNIVEVSPQISWMRKERGVRYYVENIAEEREKIMNLLLLNSETKWDLILDYPHAKEFPDFTVFRVVHGFCDRLLGRLVMIDSQEGYADFPSRADINRILTKMTLHGIDVSGLQRAIRKRKNKIRYILDNISELDKHQRKVFFEELAEKYQQIKIVEQYKDKLEKETEKVKELELQLKEKDRLIEEAGLDGTDRYKIPTKPTD